MDILFIPIKNESQRVPGKNFRELGNKELYIHQIDKFKENFKIYIDTDSIEIINKLNDYHPNVVVYKRDNNLLGHKISVNLLIENFIKRFNLDCYISQIHVTSPFLKVETINMSFDILRKGEFDSVAGSNLIKSRLWNKDSNKFIPINHDPKKLIQTQDLPDIFEDNSSLYTFHTSSFLTNKNRICNNPYFMVVDFPENVDIDTEDDWNMVNYYLRKKIDYENSNFDTWIS